MLLVEFFNSTEGDSYADHQATQKIGEAKRMSSKNDPCWKGYNMVGTKTKSDKKVPNCVPVKEDQWSGPNNAWNNGDDQWSDGRGQWSEGTEGIDSITVDVPLMIRLLEYAREDAKTDMDLHNVAEQLVNLSQEGNTLTMQHYNAVIGQKESN